MKIPDVKIIPKLYELPYMFGFWKMDPEYIELREAATGNTIIRSALLFLGRRQQYRLTLRQDEDDPDGLIMSWWLFLYEIDGPRLIVQNMGLEEEKLVKDGESFFVPWGLSRDGRLNLRFGDDDWWRYVPADLGDLEKEGYGREIIEAWIRGYRAENEPVIEIFDENIALDLIAEAQRLEEEG